MRKSHAIVFSGRSRAGQLTHNARQARRAAVLYQVGRRDARRQRVLFWCLMALLIMASCAKRLESFDSKAQEQRAAAAKEVRRG